MNKYDMYDQISSALLVSIYSKIRHIGIISFKYINFKNKAHLYVLKISETIRTLTGYDITSTKRDFSLLLYNFKNKLKIKKSSSYKIDINELLDEFRRINNLKDNSIFEAIYDEYYNQKGKSK